MSRVVPEELLSQFSNTISSHMGLHFPKDRKLDLLRGIRAASKEFKFKDVESCIRWLLSAPLGQKKIEVLAQYLTVGETYFFRETKAFKALENEVLPKIIRSRMGGDQRIRIWSAGCCTGEEPYSMAILLRKVIPDLKNWKITILGTDMNPHFLQKAAEGIYRDWSFRSTPFWVKENYFTRTRDGSYKIDAEVKRMVSFSYLNLAEDIFPSILNDTHAMDLILCRNVMIYFNQQQVKRVVDRFFHSLLNYGWFIVGSSEASHVFFPQYVSINYPGAIFFQKDKSTSKRNAKKTITSAPKARRIIPKERKRNIIPKPVEQKVIKKKTEQESYEGLVALYDQGQYTETIEKSKTILAQDENDTKVIFLISKAYANTGQIPDALKWCEKALHMDKLNPNFYHLQGVILQEQNRIEEALNSLKRALYLDPDFVLVYFMAGNLARQLGKDTEADKYFENAHTLLSKHERDSVLPEADGLTAGRLMELIQIMRSEEIPA